MGDPASVTDADMRALFDITHPAHVHLFKHVIRELEAGGAAVRVLSREKEVTTDLLDAYGIDHTVLSVKGESSLDLAREWLLREVRTVRAARRFEPDVVVSHLSPAAVHAARLSGAKSIVFNDQEHPETVPKLTAPLTTAYCTPESYGADRGARHRRYPGFHELAYLHPDRFSTNVDALREAGVDPDEPYFVCRFVSMGAYHDVGESGISPAQREAVVEALSAHGDVYVSSESPLPASMEANRLPVPPHAMHDLLAEASLLVTDSATMALEAGILGTPVVRSNSIDAGGEFGTLAELADYDLVVAAPDEGVVEMVERLGTDPDAGDRWRERREALLAEKIDVTGYALAVIRAVAAGRDAPDGTAFTETEAVFGDVPVTDGGARADTGATVDGSDPGADGDRTG